MNDFHYNGDLIGGSLMVRESRLIADLLLKNATPTEWNHVIMIENALQKRSPASSRRIAQTIRKRLQDLPEGFWKAIRDGDDELATQASFTATLQRNLLLVEFIETVLQDAYVTRLEKLEPFQWMDFLDDRANRDPGIDSWALSSKKKMGQIVFRMLAEMGYLNSARNTVLQNVQIRPELRQLLDDACMNRIKMCMSISSRADKS